jgi:hypothetical protein
MSRQRNREIAEARDEAYSRIVVERLEDVDDDGVDLSLIRWMLALTAEERLEALQGFVDSVEELRGEEASEIS